MVDFASQINAEAQQMLDHLGEIRGQLQQANARVTEAQQQADSLIAETQAAYEHLSHRLQTIRQRADQIREGVTSQVSHLTQQVEHLIQQIEQGHQQVTAAYGQVSATLGTLVNDASQHHTELARLHRSAQPPGPGTAGVSGTTGERPATGGATG